MEFFDNLPKWLVVTTTLVMVVVIGIVDKLTGDYSMLIFYMVPVFITSWFVSGRWSGLIVVAAAAARAIANVPPEGFAPLYYSLYYWNTLVDTFFLLMIGLLFSYLRKVLK